jgi:hypothetical protein
VLLVLRLSSSRAVSVREATTPAAQPTTPIRPPADARAAVPVPPAHPAPTTAAPRRDSRTAGADKLPVAGVTVVTAQVCRSFAATGSSWRCDAVGRSAPPGSMVLYTRVKSPRDTAVWHRWYRGNTLRQSVMLNIQANATDGYRTYSRLTLEEGDWRIEVRSADGELLYEQRLTVR